MSKTAHWLTVLITHDFYESGDCLALTPTLTADSEKTLRKHRCMWKEEPGRLTVRTAVKADDSGPFIPFPAGGLHLELVLYRDQRNLEAFTQLPSYPKSSEMLAADGTVGEDLTLRAVPRTAASTQANFFAQVRLHIPTQPIVDWPLQATLPLQADSATWKYFFVGEAHLSVPEVKDKNATLAFEAVVDPSDEPLATKLKAQYPDAAHILYRSTGPVTWRERRYPGIQMLRDGHLIIDNLRNPNWETQGVEIINALPNH
ncbi:MAG TPA: hypothetical protein DCE41_07670 [Cytophagales bacterium]|nr:hypothetical protein [Cytophagales bacterium]HAA24284.1 hypothetical protein [Cytophagales bacterium]HAP64337.1 hypothetical protein [Cytophagales bacterium]